MNFTIKIILLSVVIFYSVFTDTFAQRSQFHPTYESVVDSIFYNTPIVGAHGIIEANLDNIDRIDTDFLFQEVQTGVEWRKIRAIDMLRYKADRKIASFLIKQLNSFAYSPKVNNYLISSVAYHPDTVAVVGLGKLLVNEKTDPSLHYKIVNVLRSVTDISAVPYLKEFVEKTNKEYPIVIYAREVLEIIEKFNQSKESREKLMFELINGYEHKNWALNKMIRTKEDFDWIHVLKMYSKVGFEVLLTRWELGDKSFTDKEKEKLKKAGVDVG